MNIWPQKYGCLYIDITWGRIFSAYYNIISNLDRPKLQSQVESLFGGPTKCLACTSVRSALDLFLTTMNFPKGSEIIFTAINIPDMVSIVELHGLKVIPVDIDLETLAPKEELLELAITEKTVAIIVAHIYGKWVEMDKILEIAHANGIMVLEDCAECFQGFKRKGNDESDLVFYSFGLIKYSTCMGGAIVSVSDNKLLTKMRAKLETYPVQRPWMFFTKLIKYSMLTFLMNSTTLAWAVIPLFHMAGFDYKEFFISLLRGYPGQILPQLHFQPSAALLKVMFDILSNINDRDFEVIKMKGDFVGENLPENVFVPGKNTKIVNYWLFPILVDNPGEVREELEKHGIEAYQGATQLRTVYKTAASVETRSSGKENSSEESSKVERYSRRAHLPQGLHSSATLLAAPEVAAGISQSYTAKETHGDTMLASGVSQPSISPTDNAPYASSVGLAEEERNPCADQNVTHSKSLVKPLKKATKGVLYPYNAEYLINHVLYLPVHKKVPLWYLEHICNAVEKVMKNRPGVQFKNGKKNFTLPSKL